MMRSKLDDGLSPRLLTQLEEVVEHAGRAAREREARVIIRTFVLAMGSWSLFVAYLLVFARTV